METFYLVGGNCPRSREDAQTVINYFLINGFKLVKKIKKADIICIYSCGGFNTSEELSIKTIHSVLKQKSKKAKVVFTGCLVKINPDSIKKFKDLIILEFDDFSKMDEIINAKTKFIQVPDAGIINDIPRLGDPSILKKTISNLKTNPFFFKDYLKNFINKREEYDTRFYHIRITRGCLCKCSYCAIKLARGHLKSKPIEKIKKDIEDGLRKGYKKFVLVGEDTGCYGIDIDTNVVELLRLFFSFEDVKKLMINDFNPQWLIRYYDKLEPIFIKNHERIQDLRIPIQSGSNTILKLMRRPYKIEDVKRCISRIKRQIPDLRIYTHIMVGFPEETEEDFQKSLDLLKERFFYSVEVFAYQDRSMTDSAKMKDKIPSDIIERRMNRIQKYIT